MKALSPEREPQLSCQRLGRCVWRQLQRVEARGRGRRTLGAAVVARDGEALLLHTVAHSRKICSALGLVSGDRLPLPSRPSASSSRPQPRGSREPEESEVTVAGRQRANHIPTTESVNLSNTGLLDLTTV